MDTCKKCVGDGLIGAGEFPHLKQGRVETCDMCGGTGKTVTEMNAADVITDMVTSVHKVETAPEPEIVPEQPPRDNAHVAEGCEQFPEAPTEEKKSEDSEVGSAEVSA